jgi:hypothetical protein
VGRIHAQKTLWIVSAGEKLDELAECTDIGICRFAAATAEAHTFLEELLSGGKTPSLTYMLDLFANAERRLHEGKTDDAIVRLYRIIEMIAQERLRERL